ncbi:Oidioi.mRNA.OKI2018_I69.XSR.g14919.t1.cds [Oikopleura dioica]|uniref:Oidioi.mRNA.OKI2018_I69.XSR.g14919.t1.cds n=1 Tax=Oikopleura dioica TaxID=34765 RepID=A0ABN7SF43_OIKDI|nr:Oidioi.mRNA.OKI2018_I69.XSR.g14919.t1.cds [Oikopleura dioica]
MRNRLDPGLEPYSFGSFTPGKDAHFYLPRLQGAAGTATTTSKILRESCSTKCNHYWVPKVVKPRPPPKSPEPHVIYQYDYMTEQIKMWEDEIEALKTEIATLEEISKNHEIWERTRITQNALDKLNRSRDKFYDYNRTSFLKRMRLHAQRKTTREKQLLSLSTEIARLTASNENFDKYVLGIRQYKNLGAVRDRLEISTFQKKFDEEHGKTMQQIENPPYLTPEYIIPIIPPIEDPEFLVKTRNYVERITSINKTDRAEVEQLRRNVHIMEAELKDLRANWHKAYKCELDFPDDEDLSKLNIPTLQNIKLDDKLEN